MGIIKSFMRTAIRIIGYCVLLSLPITLFPSIHTVILGAKYCQFHNNRIDEGISALASEIDQTNWMNQFSVPGAPTIWEWKDNKEPFYVPQLFTLDWTKKLGLVLPRDHGIDAWEAEKPIDKIVTFEGVLRDMKSQHDYPNEWWIYASGLAWPSVFPWDAAFQQLLEYHHANPLPNGTKFAHVKCANSPFLCNVWQISGFDAGTFVHFLVREDGELGSDIDPSEYDAAAGDLRPVEVRLIDLGLQSDVSPLVPGLFPSRFEQMKALTTQQGAYTIFEEYNELQREVCRHTDKANEDLSRRRGGKLYLWVNDMDDYTTDFLAKPLGLERVVDVVASIMYFVGFAVASVATMIIRTTANSLASFLGRPTEFDELFARLAGRERESRSNEGSDYGALNNFLEQYLKDNIITSAGNRPEITAGSNEKPNPSAWSRPISPPSSVTVQ